MWTGRKSATILDPQLKVAASGPVAEVPACSQHPLQLPRQTVYADKLGFYTLKLTGDSQTSRDNKTQAK